MASELAAALAKFQAALPRIAKGETGNVQGLTKDGKPFSYNYSYAGLDEVAAVVLPLLGAQGLAFTAFPTVTDDGRFVLSYSLLHEGGEERGGTWPLKAESNQQAGIAITYARRYALLAVTGVFPGGEDDDAQSEQQRPQQQNGRIRTTGAEHERLRNGTVEPTPADRPAQRVDNSAEPPGDKWTSGPGGGGGPAASGLPLLAEDQPGSITRQQQQAMHARFAALGIPSKDRAGRMGLTIAIIGREVGSSNDLSWQEAARLLSELDERAKEGAGK
jgi:hypothetical protein